MRLDLLYTTRFVYPTAVYESQNELRACPVTDDRQQLVHYDVTVDPSARVVSYVDYWGTRVDTFGVRPPHEILEVVAMATVDTGPAALLPAELPVSRLDHRFLDEHFAFLQPSPHTAGDRHLAAAAKSATQASSSDLIEQILSVHSFVASLDYRPGATYVGIDVEQVLRQGGGVCQDFAHLAVAMYRTMGIPARYVSGYLYAADDATGEEVVGEEVTVQTHAWVEIAVPDVGWIALDPTNDQPVAERHVTIGRGRDYDDVAPFRGVYHGGEEHELEVSVRMRRLVSEPLAGAPGVGTTLPGMQAQQ